MALEGLSTETKRLRESDLYDAGLKQDVELFPFQFEDVKRLYENDVKSALIANEMGTGKTFEAIAWDLLLRSEVPDGVSKKTLVVAPLSVLPSWKQHYEMMTDLRVRVIDRKNRVKFLQDTHNADVFMLHWEALRLLPELQKMKFLHVIADEVHKAKSRKAKQTKALKKIRPTYKTGLSGTPMVNRADELWSVLDWLYPGKFGGYWKFFEKFVQYEIIYPQGFKKVIGTQNVPLLKQAIEPFYTRRLKSDVLKDLPDKYYTPIYVELGTKQRRAYDSMARDMLAWIGENEGNPLVAPVVIARLIRLQQLALSYGDIVENKDGEFVYYPTMPSAKIDALTDILEDLGDERVVIFSQFSKTINLVEEVLQKKGYSTVKLTGAVSTQNRQKNIEAFQAGKAQVFLATIAAGGTGITLTAASTAVFLDRSWSPADNFQAEDRLHRHGQKNAVQIIDLIAKNTVDLGRRQKLELKWSWIKEILG